MIAETDGPRPLSTNVFIEEWDHVKYPIVAPIPGESAANDVAVVAIVTATDAKIDFIIDVRHALRVSLHDLLHGDSWVNSFYAAFETKSGVDVKGASKGWTTEILREAMRPYRARFRTKPRCMVGVFDQINLKLFLDAFDKIISPDKVCEAGAAQLLDTAACCIQRTPFWRPRRDLGFTRLMFDLDALRRRNLFVRAFRDDLDQEEIDAIAKRSPKLYDVPTGNWGFGYGGQPFGSWPTGPERVDT